MNIIIAGDGKVGATLTRLLCAEGHNITLVDTNSRVLEKSQEQYDVMSVHGNCAAMDTLLQAGVKSADLLIAATSADEVNLLCCTTAHGLNSKLHTIARIRNPEYTAQIYKMRNIYGLSMLINPERQAASEIERLLKYPGFLRRDVFAKGRAEIVELRIDAKSKLCGVRLMDMPGIVKCRVLICAVLRNGQALVPNGTFTFQEGDRVFVTAPTKDLTTLLNNLGIITRRVKSCLLCGGGRVCIYLATALQKSGISVTIVEKDYDRCQQLCEALPGVSVIRGNAGNTDLLESEGLSKYDAVVTLTGEEELNMIISLHAGSVGVPQVITKLGYLPHQGILDSLKLGSIVCPKELVANDIVRYVRAMQNQSGAAVSVHAIADSQVEALEFLVDENTKGCGTPLKQLKLKSNVLIAGIIHGSATEIPNGDSTFDAGDSLVVVTTNRGSIRQVGDIFA